MPVHFYSPLPNTKALSDSLWGSPSSLVGLDVDLDAQVQWLESVSDNYLKEYHAIEGESNSASEWSHGCGFSGMDGAVLYSMIRRVKPKRIIEIGSGYSTLLSILALQRNRQEDTATAGKILAIEPYPKTFLKEKLRGYGKLICKNVEHLPLSEFEALNEHDILFIDSTHTVKIGGDVNYEILEIIPRLNTGVIIHFHDIFLPLEYPRKWIKKRRFWAEQYLLQAFLAFNKHYRIIWSAGCMHVYMPDKLAKYFAYYDPGKQQGGSFWIKKCK